MTPDRCGEGDRKRLHPCGQHLGHTRRHDTRFPLSGYSAVAHAKEAVTMAGTDAMRERIAAHPWPCGGVEVIRANRGYTLYSRRTGGQVARLQPTGENDDVQVLWWRGT